MYKNISEYIPYEAISCNLLVNENHKEYPFFSGTGFFVQFQPYDYIFYITAKHCFTEISDSDNGILETLRLPYELTNTKPTDQAILFSEILFGQDKDDEEYEDILVFVVDNNIDTDKIELLKKRALNLSNQNEIDSILKFLCKNDGNIRTVGFPTNSKEIIYETKQLAVEARGYYGKIKDNCKQRERYGFEEASWKENVYYGFSGSPILALIPDKKEHDIDVVTIGILLTATSSRGEFLSINFATNLIANYIKANKT